MENTKKRNIPSNLPEVEFVDTNTEALVNKLIAGYEEITGRTLYPADPVRAFILWLASVLVQERVQINESAKQNLPRYAVGKNLDSLSEIFHNTYRLQPTAASTTLGFYITTTLAGLHHNGHTGSNRRRLYKFCHNGLSDIQGGRKLRRGKGGMHDRRNGGE